MVLGWLLTRIYVRFRELVRQHHIASHQNGQIVPAIKMVDEATQLDAYTGIAVFPGVDHYHSYTAIGWWRTTAEKP